MEQSRNTFIFRSIHQKLSMGVSFSVGRTNLPSSCAMVCETHLTDIEMPRNDENKPRFPQDENPLEILGDGVELFLLSG
jgi:hypothetical protein